MTGFKMIFYKLYIFLLGIWMGAGIYMLFESQGWYDDPVGYVDHKINYPVPGAAEFWPVLTISLAVLTLLTMFLFLRYHGRGRRTALSAFTATFIVILFTYLYFIPAQEKIFDETGTYSQDQVAAMSRGWIVANYFRVFLVVIIFFTSLIALNKFKMPSKNIVH